MNYLKKYLLVCFFLTYTLLCFSQKDTIRGKYYIDFPQEKVMAPKDSVLRIMIPKQKPGNFFGDLLYYISPTKYFYKDSVIPIAALKDISDDTTSTLLPQSNHVEENFMNYNLGTKTDEEWSELMGIKKTPVFGGKPKKINKIVYGYHPFWMGNAYESYNFSLLTRLAYFSYELDATTGNYTSIGNWKTTALIDSAKKYGCKVDLCITSFGQKNNSIFLTNQKSQETLIKNLITLLQERKANGVNINFEGIAKANKYDFTNFITNLNKLLHQSDTNYTITVTIPAIDWKNAYDVDALKAVTDYFFLMGYDYYGKYSKVAGPVTLLFSGSNWTVENINNTVNYYIEHGVKKSSIILGLPYYANEWETKDGNIPSESIRFVKARTLKFVNDNYASKYIAHYDSSTHSIYYIFRQEDKWYQCWAENEFSLSIKYDYINEKQLGGLGIWALGYDNGYPEMWNLIRKKFSKEPDTTKYATLYEQIYKSLDNSVSKKAFHEISKTKPDYTPRFIDRLSKSWRTFALIFIILMAFAIVGFIIAITDYDVRFALFTKEVRIYIFFIFILTALLLLLRIMNVLANSDVILLLAVILGIATAILMLNLGKQKRKKQGELRP